MKTSGAELSSNLTQGTAEVILNTLFAAKLSYHLLDLFFQDRFNLLFTYRDAVFLGFYQKRLLRDKII